MKRKNKFLSSIAEKIVVIWLCGFLIFVGSFPQGSAFISENLSFESPENALSFAEYFPFPFSLLSSMFFLLFYGQTASISKENSTENIGGAISPFEKEDMKKYIPTEGKIEVSLWMMDPTASAFQKDFQSLETAFPNITLNTKIFADEDIYLRELEKAFETEEKPDIFLANSLLLHQLQKKGEIAPAPENIFRPEEIQKYFHPIAQDFVTDNKVWAAPIYGNFLGMISNSALLTDDRIFVAAKPGKTWSEITENFERYLKFGEKNIIPFGIGYPQIFPETFHIFLLLLEQSQVQNLENQNAEDALTYIVNFGTSLPKNLKFSDLKMFVEGKVAVVFGDERAYLQILELLRSEKEYKKEYLREENLQVQIMPQYTKAQPETIGEIWGFAVSKNTVNTDFAWAIATSLSDEREAKAHYLKTHFSPLLKSLSNDWFLPMSASIGVSATKWKALDFQEFFEKNVNEYISNSSSKQQSSVQEMMNLFSDFFHKSPNDNE
ncbi:extracellular solute-binding protein [Candidatus Peregrinibacteria bacterium]|nr:extracellular solute-binding protein [Candidatus Peregrinibacteria bacterium]